MVIIDLNHIEKPEDIEPLLSEVLDQNPDVLVFVGYKRNMQERILHPLQNVMKSTYAYARDGILVVMEKDIKDTLRIDSFQGKKFSDMYINLDYSRGSNRK